MQVTVHSEVLDWEESLPSWVHTADGDRISVDLIM